MKEFFLNWLEEILDLLNEFKTIVLLIVVVFGLMAGGFWFLFYLMAKPSNNMIVLDGNLWKCTAENTYTQVQNIQVGNVSVPQVMVVSECVAYSKK